MLSAQPPVVVVEVDQAVVGELGHDQVGEAGQGSLQLQRGGQYGRGPFQELQPGVRGAQGRGLLLGQSLVHDPAGLPIPRWSLIIASPGGDPSLPVTNRPHSGHLLSTSR
jgi:hypothetical protein